MTEPVPCTTTVPAKPAGPMLGVITEPLDTPAASVESACNRITVTSEVGGAAKDIVVEQDPDAVAAVTVADWDERTVPVVAVNAADSAPYGTETVAGTTSAPLEDANATAVPPAGAACERVTVQLAVEPVDRAEGEH